MNNEIKITFHFTDGRTIESHDSFKSAKNCYECLTSSKQEMFAITTNDIKSKTIIFKDKITFVTFDGNIENL